MSSPAVQTISTERVQMALEALRAHLDQYFDRGWLAMIIEDLPLDSSHMREIRALLSLQVIYAEDLPELVYGVERLESFAKELHRHLVPVLRDRLGVSGFTAGRFGRARDERVHRQFVCMTFPHNLQRLEELTARLSGELAGVTGALAR
ncbi:MAG: hypothetical protein ACOC1U_08370 [Spirochaetota bacterium]